MGLNSTLQDRVLESFIAHGCLLMKKQKIRENTWPGWAETMGTLQNPRRRERCPLSGHVSWEEQGMQESAHELYPAPPSGREKSSHHATPTRLTSQPAAAPQCTLSTARHAWVRKGREVRGGEESHASVCFPPSGSYRVCSHLMLELE